MTGVDQKILSHDQGRAMIPLGAVSHIILKISFNLQKRYTRDIKS